MKNNRLFALLAALTVLLSCVFSLTACAGSEPVLNYKKVEIEVGQSVKLELINAADVVTWSVEQPEVATVADGVVTGVGAGQTYVTATCGNKTYQCTVKVTGDVIAVGTYPVLVFEAKADSVYAGYEFQLQCGVYVGNKKQDATITFVSSDPAVATVDENGYVIALAEGTTTLTAKSTYNGETLEQSTVLNVVKDASYIVATNIVNDMLILGENETFQLEVALFTNGNKVNDAQYTWSSSDESVVKTNGGKLVANNVGTAAVMVQAGTAKKTVQIVVLKTSVVDWSKSDALSKIVYGKYNTVVSVYEGTVGGKAGSFLKIDRDTSEMICGFNWANNALPTADALRELQSYGYTDLVIRIYCDNSAGLCGSNHYTQNFDENSLTGGIRWLKCDQWNEVRLPIENVLKYGYGLSADNPFVKLWDTTATVYFDSIYFEK